MKDPLAPLYKSFEGERAPKKNAIFVKVARKNPKKVDKVFKTFLKIIDPPLVNIQSYLKIVNINCNRTLKSFDICKP